MKYGLLDNKTISNFFRKEINSCKYCKDCKLFRSVFSKKDKKHNNSYSNLLPGFSSKNLEIPIDVLVIAEAHGGGRKSTFRTQKELAIEVNEIGNYYLVDPIKKFHQKEMRDLFEELEKRNLTWVFADLIRCFVWQGNENKLDGRKNVQQSIIFCKKYLDKEISFLKPKKIICLGKKVAEKYFGIKDKLAHGSICKSNVIWSYFPSRNTADIWVASKGWTPIFTQIERTF